MLQKEFMQRTLLLRDLIYKAKGTNTFRMFYNKLGIDVIYMERLFRGEESNFPHRDILRKISQASEGRVTYEELTRACGYTLRELVALDKNNVKRGDIFYIDLGEDVIGSEQGGLRPCVIIQNPAGNLYSPTVIVAIITSQLKNLNQPTHVVLGQECGLSKTSMIELEQVKTVDKRRLKEYIGTVTREDIKKINKAIEISMGTYDETDRLIETIENIDTAETSIFKKLLNALLYKLRNRQLNVA